MKGFFRTVAGKTILFILCLISFLTVGACIFGAIASYELDFYYKSEESVYEEFNRSMALDDWLALYNSEDYETDGGIKIYSEGTGNIIFEVYGENGKITEKSSNAYTNDRMDHSFDYDIELCQYLNSYRIKSFRTGGRTYHYTNYSPEETTGVHLKISFLSGMPVTDIYGLNYRLFHIGYALKYWVFAIGIVAGLIGIACFIGLMCVSARRPQDDGLYPGPLNKIPFDIVLAVTGFLVIMTFAMIDDIADGRSYFVTSLTRGGALGIVLILTGIGAVMAMILGMFMGIAARVKQQTLLKNTVIYRLLVLLGRFFKGVAGIFVKIPLVWKTVLITISLLFMDIILILGFRRDSDMLGFWFIVSRLFTIAAVTFLALRLRSLQHGAEALASGDLNYRTDTKGLFLDLKTHAENLNRISDGMNTAVEQRLKSERMKTELITNVSHDIKTPLTSIINYVGLIAKEDCDNKKHAEYSEVLIRQSNRLKKLIEDLVEASKASTGNLDVQLAPCDAQVFLTQASGEYEEKLKASDLTLIVKQPEEKLTIMADGRRMWRIFDNLMNNICKYSLPGTRVYLTLERNGNMAQFQFKNTSREVLDISEEELMERFVRGDSSRNTEGNGLGLSIAKSMAQLQNGLLRIETDGDLFKAILSFPIANNF
ncbi:MAG: HAMP domain-containing histidine kinase [Lachnospiraceae bacterium]|nr:HAMP domain-containing histidine kinase [Lachnospiraceae bacterium]